MRCRSASAQKVASVGSGAEVGAGMASTVRQAQPGRHRRDRRHRLAGRHHPCAGHPVRDLRVHGRRPAGGEGLQQRVRRAGLRSPAARPDRPGGRGGGSGLARAPRVLPGHCRGGLGAGPGLRRVLPRVPQRGGGARGERAAAARAEAGTTPIASVRADDATTVHVRHGRLRAAAARRGVPLATILVTVAVVVLVYLAGKLAYRIRDVLLMIAVAGFISLILNPLVVALQRWRIRRRGWAVSIVALWTVLVLTGLLAAFGYPLAHGVTHFSQRLPSYVQAAGHRPGRISQLVTRFHLQAWVNRNAPQLQSLGTTLAKPALTAGKRAASLLATLATIFALIVLFHLDRPKMREGLLQLMRPERADYYARVAREISEWATG